MLPVLSGIRILSFSFVALVKVLSVVRLVALVSVMVAVTLSVLSMRSCTIAVI